MKRRLTFSLIGLLAVLAVNVTMAQTTTPDRVKYQAVLRDATGNIIANNTVTVVVDILSGSSTGPIVYEETQSITTTMQGVINLTIGAGTVNVGNIATINWANNTYWVKVTVNGVSITNDQLLSVPYALNVKGISQDPSTGFIGIGTNTPANLLDIYGTGPRTNFTVKSNNSTFGPEVRLTSTATSGREWRLVSGASSSNSYGVGSFEIFDASGGGARFGILPNGNIGIGTVSPTAKLDLVGGLRIADGSQGNGKILQSDANGYTTWITSSATRYAVVATLTSTPWNWTTGSPAYTGSTITLAPGKWSVQIVMLIPNVAGLDCWVRSTLTDGAGNPNPSGDILGSAVYFSGNKAPSRYGIAAGTIIINNTSGSNKTYYYWGLNCEIYAGSFNLANFGTSLWMEDQIVAYPMN